MSMPWTEPPYEELKNQIKLDAVQELDEPVQLASGQMSDWYVNLRTLMTHYHPRVNMGACLYTLIQAKFPTAMVVAGPMSGACPLVVEIQNAAKRVWRAHVRIARVRKAAKSHGQGELIVGRISPGDRVVIVEDVMTTGGSAVQADHAITEMGAEVLGYVSVVNREGITELAERPVWSLFYGKELAPEPAQS